MSAVEQRMAVVRPLPVEFVADVVNGWGTAPRQAAGEQDSDYPGIAALAAAHQLDADPATELMSDHGLTCVADALYPIFSAPAEDAVVAEVNDLLARSAPQPRLVLDGWLLIGTWTAPASQQFLVACLLTLYQQLILWGSSRRLGLCAGARCADVYVDSSPGGHKRFCSLTCQNRSRVAAFRARRRHAGHGQGISPSKTDRTGPYSQEL
ncbi:MAG TPA: CGNR zinc finger domain-containing protein [Streptosporangiaceae bacterium]|nr:CGNR zinc finger domain-containing protein [Streptosporangiaceae bacterium]